jgi:hypothetical protein
MLPKVGELVIGKANRIGPVLSVDKVVFRQWGVSHVIKMEEHILPILITLDEAVAVLLVVELEESCDFHSLRIYVLLKHLRCWLLLHSIVVVVHIIHSDEGYLRLEILPWYRGLVHVGIRTD